MVSNIQILYLLIIQCESNHWHEWPAIVKSNLKSILVFVKHTPGVQSTINRLLDAVFQDSSTIRVQFLFLSISL